MTSPRITATLLWLGAGFLGSSSAGTAPASAPSAPASAPSAGATGILNGQLAEGSLYDQLWSTAVLYKNDANPYLQELALQGQLQTQYAYGSSESGSYGTEDLAESSTWDDIEVRRFRLGMKARLFRSIKFE